MFPYIELVVCSALSDSAWDYRASSRRVTRAQACSLVLWWRVHLLQECQDSLLFVFRETIVFPVMSDTMVTHIDDRPDLYTGTFGRFHVKKPPTSLAQDAATDERTLGLGG